MNKSFKSRVRGCFASIFFGDILGLPFEMKTKPQIREELGGRSVLDFHDPREFRNDELPDYVNIGTYSDDWQLTSAVATSLIRKHGFDLDDLVNIHVEEYDMTTFGWGKTTRNAIASAKVRLSKPDGQAFVPVDFELGRGAGNGVAMKVAPIALMQLCHPANDAAAMTDQIRSLGQITHGDPRAHVAALALALGIHAACTYREDENISVDEIKDSVMFHLQIMEENINPKDLFLLPTVTRQLSLLMEPETLRSAEALSTKIGVGCVAWESVPFAIGVAFRHRNDLTIEAGLKEAIEAGGDTDSNAAMVGALLGARLGEDGIPESWRRRFPNAYKQVIALADDFIRTFCPTEML